MDIIFLPIQFQLSKYFNIFRFRQKVYGSSFTFAFHCWDLLNIFLEHVCLKQILMKMVYNMNVRSWKKFKGLTHILCMQESECNPWHHICPLSTTKKDQVPKTMPINPLSSTECDPKQSNVLFYFLLIVAFFFLGSHFQ